MKHDNLWDIMESDMLFRCATHHILCFCNADKAVSRIKFDMGFWNGWPNQKVFFSGIKHDISCFSFIFFIIFFSFGMLK